MTRAQLPSEVRSRGVQIEPRHPVFAKADRGPFLCGTCEYFHAGTCQHTYIRRLAQTEEGRRQGLTWSGGQAIVGPKDCCDFHDKSRQGGG